MPKRLPSSRARSGLDDLPFYLVRASVGFRRINEFTLREAGMKSQPIGAGSILHALFEEDCRTVKSLIQRTELPNGTITGLLDGLEEEGFIRRKENATDGRSWLIELAPRGYVMKKSMMRRHQIVMKLFDAVLSPQEVSLLKRALRRLTKSMNDYVDTRQTKARKSKLKQQLQKTSK